MSELKRLSTSAIPGALEKAERYRFLNEPEEAQSICEDVLSIDPSNFDAMRMLILALSDSFPQNEKAGIDRALELVARLPSEYDRAYYGGLVNERRVRAMLGHGRDASEAEVLLRDAMRAFERAEAVKPADNDDALLRWNACVRLLQRHPGLAVTDDSTS